MYINKVIILGFLLAAAVVRGESAGPALGRPATAEMISSWNLNVFPDGDGLPEGRGSVSDGQKVYRQYCQSCHGVDGSGGSAEELAGAQHSLTDEPPDKTIGNYWPYATTLFDFIRRSMPMDRPGILDNNKVYAVSAYLLYLNGIVKKQAVMDAGSLAKIVMPNRYGFINFNPYRK